jgi:hypothetical protein
MGSKSSKWLAAGLAATALAVVPAGAVAKLDYSKNSVSGQYLPSPARLVAQINDVSTPTAGAPAPAKVVAPVAQSASGSASGFAWGDALAGAGVALALALSAGIVVRRRHGSPLATRRAQYWAGRPLRLPPATFSAPRTSSTRATPTISTSTTSRGRPACRARTSAASSAARSASRRTRIS